jgi:hypothetical protein
MAGRRIAQSLEQTRLSRFVMGFVAPLRRLGLRSFTPRLAAQLPIVEPPDNEESFQCFVLHTLFIFCAKCLAVVHLPSVRCHIPDRAHIGK